MDWFECNESVLASQTVLERWDIIIGVERKMTIGRRAKNVKQMIRAAGLKCDLILLRPNLYTMGEKEPFKFRR